MDDEDIIRLFEDPKIRTVHDMETNETYYSVLDTIKVITNCKNPEQYWENIVDDGKLFGTDLTSYCKTFDVAQSGRIITGMEFATKEHIFRIISSIPSPKAEPYKEWLSFQGLKRINQLLNPEMTLKDAIKDYNNLGFGEDCIGQKFRFIS